MVGGTTTRSGASGEALATIIGQPSGEGYMSTRAKFLVVGIAAVLAGYAYALPYHVLVTVGVWRAAARYAGDPRLAETARIVTLVGAVLLSVT